MAREAILAKTELAYLGFVPNPGNRILQALEPLQRKRLCQANMAPRECLGFVANAEGEAADPCVFNGNGTGRPANALVHGRCVWCCPEEMNRRLATARLEKLLIYTLANFKNMNEDVFEKAKARLPEDRRADILAEVRARLEPEDEEGVAIADEAEGESEEDEAEAERLAGSESFVDQRGACEEGELDIDAVDVGELAFGNVLGEVESPFKPLEPEQADIEMGEEEGETEAPAKKRRLRGKQAAPVYGPPRPLPALMAAIGAAAVVGQAPRRVRRQYPGESCPGRDGAPCSWSSAVLGAPAGVHASRGQTHCVFCSDAQLDKILEQQSGFQLTKTLRALRELEEMKYEAALENLKARRGEALAADFSGRVDLAIFRAVLPRAPRKSVPEHWRELLQRRVRSQGPLGVTRRSGMSDKFCVTE